eukprot:gene16557-19666_t
MNTLSHYNAEVPARRLEVPGSRKHTIKTKALEAFDVEKLELPDFTDKDENFCGSEGQVIDRPSIDAEKENGLYYIRTFGCQMNMADSERMAGVMENMGLSCTDDPDKANVLVYNTCSIRDKAEQKVYGALGRQAKRKRKDPNMKIVVAGCVASQEGEALLRRVPEVDLVMGPHHANRIDELLDRVDLGSQVCATEEIQITEDLATPRRDSDISAWVNIIYGCNENCSYCVVPKTRGREQSRQPANILEEMRQLGEQGYKEVTLLGQNIDAYGRDLEVADLVKMDRLHRLNDLVTQCATERSSRYLGQVEEVLVDGLNPKSGDNDILREMKRGYTHERYRRIIDTIRHYDPEAAVSGDAIVGFPGETEEQFQRTMHLVQEIGFDVVNTAAYSPRPFTEAAVWEDQWTFTDLLYYIHDVPGIERIRFATSHPRYFTERLIKRLIKLCASHPRYFTERLIKACAQLPKMMPFYHIPFQ